MGSSFVLQSLRMRKSENMADTDFRRCLRVLLPLRLFRWLVNIRMVLSSAGTGCRIMYYLDPGRFACRGIFESILLGSEETVAQVGAGFVLTMPIKAYDLVNTADMVLRQLERRINQTPKSR